MLVIKLVAYLKLLTTFSDCRLIPNSTSGTLIHLQTCVNEIVQKFFNPNDFIVFLNLNATFEDLRFSPIVLQGYLRELISFRLIKADAYILTLTEEFSEITFEFLSRTSQWNPRARFIVILEGNPSDLSIILRRYYVFNVAILSLKSEVETEILTYFPYNLSLSEMERTRAGLIDRCVEGEVERGVNLFPRKLPRKWNNTTIKALLFEFPPFVICRACPDEKKLGIEIDLFKLIKHVLGFQIDYMNKTYSNWGRKLDNGSYDGYYGELQNYQADVAIGFFYANSSESWDFDLSFPYLEDSSKWFVPSAKRQPHWSKIIAIFDPFMWIALGAILCLTSILLYFFTANVSEMKHFQSISICFLVCYQCLISQGVHFLPRTMTMRITIVTWIYFSLVIGSAFQTELTSVLNFDAYDKQISNVKELVASNLKIGFYKQTSYLFSYSDSKEDAYIYNHYTICPLDSSCIDRVAFKGDFATLKPKKFLEFMTINRYLDSNGRPLAYIFKENIYNVLISLAFSKGFPMVETINRVLINLRESGFVGFYCKIAEYLTEKAYKKAQGVKAAETLDLDEVQGIFGLLLVGWMIALIVFVLENLAKPERVLLPLWKFLKI